MATSLVDDYHLLSVKPKSVRDSAIDNFRQKIYYQSITLHDSCVGDPLSIADLGKYYRQFWDKYHQSPRRPANFTSESLEKYIVSRLLANRTEDEWDAVCQELLTHLSLPYTPSDIRPPTVQKTHKKPHSPDTEPKPPKTQQQQQQLPFYRSSFSFFYGVVLSDGRSFLYDKSSIK